MGVYAEHVDPYRMYLYGPVPEESLVQGPQGIEAALEGFYTGRQIGRIRRELSRLFDSYYHSALVAGQVHCAASASWRDESVMNLDSARSRFATRIHLFEDSGGGQVGRYLGFATLRPGDADGTEPESGLGFHYVIEAELVCPKQMLRPRFHVISSTSSSARLGVLPFRSSVFMPPPIKGDKSTCVHLALSQALHLVMGRFGVRPISQREFEAILWDEDNRPAKSEAVRPKRRPLAQIARDGASLPEALQVMERCAAGGFLSSFIIPGGKSPDEIQRIEAEALRCLTDTLANGLPVILMVARDALPSPGEKANPAEPRETLNHGILILGMHLLHSASEVGGEIGDEAEHFAELPGRFVAHDVVRGPYVEWSAHELLRAAVRADPTAGEARGIHFLAVGPRSLSLGLDWVRETGVKDVMRSMYDLSQEVGIDESDGRLRYLEEYSPAGTGTTPLAAADWRYVVRLVGLSELQSRYHPEDAHADEASGEGRRVEGSARFRYVFAGAAGRERPGTPYYWAVEVRLPKEKADPLLKIPPLLVCVWAIDTKIGRGRDVTPRMVRVWMPGGGYRLSFPATE